MPLTLDSSLEARRLLIRLVTAADLPGLLVVNGDDEVTRHLPYATWQSLDDAQAWFARMTAMHAAGTALQFAITEKRSGVTIGSCLLFRFDETSARAELGYVLGRAYWGQGYMHEALQRLIACAFGELALRRLEAEVDPRNGRSARLLARLGFACEGLLPQRWLTKGEACDVNVYGLLNRAWQAP